MRPTRMKTKIRIDDTMGVDAEPIYISADGRINALLIISNAAAADIIEQLGKGLKN